MLTFSEYSHKSMLTGIVIIVFIIGYLAIAVEHKIRIDKAATALLTGVICWTLYFVSGKPLIQVEHELLQHLGEISAILFFLLGAMTIVEVIDSHSGFSFIMGIVKTRSKVKLLIWISVITFFLSAVLDNLTTAIVMTSLCRKLLPEKKDRMWFVSMVIIAANAGGAWSPLGDVTTTMLWIGGQISALNIIIKTLIPSMFVAAVPMIILANRFRGGVLGSAVESKPEHRMESNIMLMLGMGMLMLVPVFKMLTHTPPFMGMLLSLGIVWIVSSIIHLNKHAEVKHKYSVAKALQNIDTSSILFFLGILLAVSALQSIGVLSQLAYYITERIDNQYVIGIILGLFSAVIDNVPLVAAAQGMFSLDMYPKDHVFWEFLALATGTGGSAIIIGSAAGVAVMGIEKISFFWYLRNICWLALLGFFAGAGIFILQQWLTVTVF